MTSTGVSELERIVKEARDVFIVAKTDGKLDAAEIIQIGLTVARGVQKIASLSGAEKKAVVLLALKKGLDAAGGLPVIEGATPEVMASVEKQLFAAAEAAVDVAIAVANGKFDLRKPASWKTACLPLCLPLFSSALAPLAASVPKDQPILQEALSLVAEKAGVPTQESSASSAPVPDAAPVEDKTPEQPTEKEPSPEAEVPAPPVSVEEVVPAPEPAA